MRESIRQPRPKLILDTPHPPGEVLGRIERAVARPGSVVRGTVLDSHVELLIAPGERHFWSPWFSARVHAGPGGGAHLRGRFGPHPHLWTMFAAAYAVGAFIAIGAGVYGVSQWMLDRPAWALWGLPAGLGLLGLLYLVARLGQRLGHDQMAVIEALVLDAVDPAPGEPPGAPTRGRGGGGGADP